MAMQGQLVNMFNLPTKHLGGRKYLRSNRLLVRATPEAVRLLEQATVVLVSTYRFFGLRLTG